MANLNPRPLTPEAIQRLHAKMRSRHWQDPTSESSSLVVVVPPQSPVSPQDTFSTLISGVGEESAQTHSPYASPPSTPPRAPRQRQQKSLTPAERAKRREKIEIFLEADHERQQQAEPSSLPVIKAPNFGLPSKSYKSTPILTAESATPQPTTKRTFSLPILGGSDDYRFIGFDSQVQALMNCYRLPWAVQYEVSRYRSQNTAFCFSLNEYNEIFEKLCQIHQAVRTKHGQLDGSNIEARQVFSLIRSIYRKRPPSKGHEGKESQLDSMELRIDVSQIDAKDPYVELDFEEKAILAGSGAGLGLSPDSPDGPEWYGGRVAQCVTLVEHPKKKNPVLAQKPNEDLFTLVLMKHKIAPSTRVSRMFGSRRILQCSISKKVVKKRSEALRNFFWGKRFVLNGRVFEAICAKDETVYMLETGDYIEGVMQVPTLDHISNNGRMTMGEFFDWHNPIIFNSRQTISKWSARFSLGFSRSIPACRFDPRNILEMQDIRNGAGLHDWEVMTDGCGFMNREVALQVQRMLDLKHLPTAIQARVGGVKGMFMLHPSLAENALSQPRLWCRSSQIKIRHGQHFFVTSSHSQLTLDLLRCAHPKMPANLSRELISCLDNGGVTADLFEQILIETLEQKFTQLATWDGKDARVRLWHAVFDLEHVLQGRLRRETAGASRAWGYGEALDITELEFSFDSDDEDETEEMSVSGDPEQTSGLPAGLAEQVLHFLMQGFHPNEAPILKEKLDKLILRIVQEYVKKYRLVLERSVEAFALPDPLGVLEPGQVYFRGTTSWQNRDGSWSDTLLGDVLATRHPCKVASDVQKFVAVDCPELREWPDVVLFSTKGARSPLSLLGGGDYDGDTVVVIFEPEIVNAFRNAPLLPNGLCQGDPAPDFIEKYFDKSVQRLDQFLRVESDHGVILKILQKMLLAPLVNQNTVGMYSTMHEKACLEYGYNDPKTIILAQKFCQCLDGVKAGLTIKPSVKNEDKKLFDSISLPKSRGGQQGFTDESWMVSPRKRATKSSSLPPDVIERLWDMGQTKAIEYRKILSDPERKGGRYNDPVLCEPYESACARAKALMSIGIGEAMKEDIEEIEATVDWIRDEYDERVEQKKYPLKQLAWKERREVINSVATELKASLEALDITVLSKLEAERVAASYAYVSDMRRYNRTHPKWQDKGTDFPFNVMFRELANIKAQSKPHAIAITEDFSMRLVVHSSFVRKH
ncbi:hypothetical protein DL93DRAFT_2224612 [Clavulina sp. PMI_390]|nr:hypothetical protein DL93DRAFT_2224612 [Clavulina sp. PMI_390]